METKTLSKAEIKFEENSTFLHSYSFKINTDKSQGNESALVYQLWKLSSSDSDKKHAKHIAE